MRQIDGNTESKLAVAILAVFLLLGPAASAQTAVPPVAPRRLVVVSIPDRKLALIEDGQIVRIFNVAVGRDISPTPTGTFTIVNRVTHPAYYHDGKVIPPGKNNPVGDRWIGLSKKHYAIHGTDEPRSIGQAASHGCVRMGARDIAALFALVRAGDTVEIHGERDAQVAQIFGAQPEITAQLQPAGSAAGTR